MLHMGYVAEKSSVLGIKNCIDTEDKVRASLVCHPNPGGNGGGNPAQTPPGLTRRRLGESCISEEWEGIAGGEQRGVLRGWHHPSSDQAQPAPAPGSDSTGIPLQEFFPFAFFNNSQDTV